MKQRLRTHILTYLLLLVAALFPLSAAADTAAKNAFQALDRGDYMEAYLFAKKSSLPYVQNLMAWHGMRRDPDNWRTGDMMRFLINHYNWPDIEDIQNNLEKKLLAGEASNVEMRSWFHEYPPQFASGKLAKLMLDSSGRKLNAAEINQLRKLWHQADFLPKSQLMLLAKYKNYLTDDDHFERAGRLVWERQYGLAKLMLPLLSNGQQAYIEARIALQTKNKKAPSLFSKVPTNLRNLLGMSYSRLVWRDSKKDRSGAYEMLTLALNNPPYPEKWWPYKHKFIRDALDDGNWDRALKLLQNHGLTDGAEFAEAAWLKGWLLLTKKQNANAAYREFDALYRGVSYAISKSRGAYWAGRAADAMNETKTAQEWYKIAATFPTTFYGQLAHAKIYPNQPLTIAASPQLNNNLVAQADQSTSLLGVLRLAKTYDQRWTYNTFMKHFILNAESYDTLWMLVGAIHQEFGRHLGVKAAKLALQRNAYFADASYPLANFSNSHIEPALMYAIIRQESEFNESIESPAGALGLMQLMPATAAHVAKKLEMPYKKSKLTDPAYNVQLGSYYLGSMLERYDGSYILAIASYNAGPGNVDKWVKRYGQPPRNLEAAVNWMESIPFSETRNYVQRVLENLQVYRMRVNGQQNNVLQIEKDLQK